MFADEFLPTYDVSDSVAVVVDASPARTWDALMDADLVDVGRRKPLVVTSPDPVPQPAAPADHVRVT